MRPLQNCVQKVIQPLMKNTNTNTNTNTNLCSESDQKFDASGVCARQRSAGGIGVFFIILIVIIVIVNFIVFVIVIVLVSQ